MMFIVSALAALAIVTQDQAALRAAPRDNATQQAQLWAGDSLEIRAEKGDFLQVWDHRRERGGYIRAHQVRAYAMSPADAPGLLAVTQFLRDSAGQEALGIGYAAAYLKAAPAGSIGPDVFDALGIMADRLAWRASQSRGKAGDATTAAQLEVVATYGVGMTSFERDGRVRICYDGEAFRRVMALPQSTPQQKARAALALTRHDCVDPDLAPSTRASLDSWRHEVLARVDTATLAPQMKNRIHMRRAGVLAAIAYQQARRGEDAYEAAGLAVQSLAAVNKNELTEDETYAYSDAGVRVGAVRWAAETMKPSGALSLTTHPGQPGETCIQLVDAKHKATLFERCTWGIVWPGSFSVNAKRTAATFAVQTGETWRELWVLRQGDDGWYAAVVPPAAVEPDLGYIEFAGWVPGGEQILSAREVRADGRFKRSFEILSLDSLQVVRWADKPESLSAFYRWQDAQWKRGTVSLR